MPERYILAAKRDAVHKKILREFWGRLHGQEGGVETAMGFDAEDHGYAVAIVGSRDITDPAILKDAIKAARFKIGTVISGGARGVDSLAEEWATKNGKPLIRFLPDWERYGKSAGFIRNRYIVDYSRAVIAITNGSKGTQHSINLATKANKALCVFRVTDGKLARKFTRTGEEVGLLPEWW